MSINHTILEIARATGISQSLLDSIHVRTTELDDCDSEIHEKLTDESTSSYSTSNSGNCLSLPDSFDDYFGNIPVITPAITKSDFNVNMTMTKDALRCLLKESVVSEAHVTQCKFKSEDELSCADILALHIAEQVIPLRRALDDARGALDTTRKELRLSLSAIESQGQELQRYRQLSDLETQQLAAECDVLRARTAELAASLSSESRAKQDNASKASKYDSAVAEVTFFRDEVSALRCLLSDQSEITKALQEEGKVLRGRTAEAEHERDIFRADKLFLQREIDSANHTVDSLRRRCDEQELLCRRAEARATELADQQVTLRAAERQDIDASSRLELERLRELILRETEIARIGTEQAIERENRTLKEALMSAQTELSVLKREKDELRTQNTRITIDSSARIQKKDFEINELRTNLKIKAFETTSLGILFEERADILRRRDIEVSRLTEEIAILRTALAKADLGYPENSPGIDDDKYEFDSGSNIPVKVNTTFNDLQVRSYFESDGDRELIVAAEIAKLKTAQADLFILQHLVSGEQSSERLIQDSDSDMKFPSDPLSIETPRSLLSSDNVIDPHVTSNVPIVESTVQSTVLSSQEKNCNDISSESLVLEDADGEETESIYARDSFDDPCSSVNNTINTSTSLQSKFKSTLSGNFGSEGTNRKWHERFPI